MKVYMDKNKAIFLDRDGTINIEKNYLYRIEDLEFEEGSLEGLKILKELGYLLIVITNQSGIGRGYYTVEEMKILNAHMGKITMSYGAPIEKFYYCPHVALENCECRKPNPGMIMKAADEFNVDLKKSYMVGDKLSDALAGERAGVEGIILETGHREIDGTDSKFKIFKNLLDFAQHLKNL